jgi:putative hemolysin
MLGVSPAQMAPVTEEEVKILIAQGTKFGVFEEEEQELVERVFRLGDRRVSGLMTHRTDIEWLDLDDPPEASVRKITDSIHSRFPLCQGNIDNVLGVVQARDLLARSLAGEPINLKASLHPPMFVPESMPALKLLEQFKDSLQHMALVIDEYGGIQGLVTINDVLEAIVGDIRQMGEETEPRVLRREDGSWLLDGTLPFDEVKDILGIGDLPLEGEGHFETLGGFMMAFLGRIPSTTDHFELGGMRFEVIDMDGLRVDKVLVALVQPVDSKPR